MKFSICIPAMLCILLLPFSGTEAIAQSDRVYTLKECMEFALANSADMEVQRANIDDDRIARRDAILNAFTPSVDAQGNVYSNFGRTIDPETNTYVSTTSFNNAFGVSAGITLFNGFQAVNNMRIAKTAQIMGLSEERQAADKICLATIEAYYNVVYYTQLADILKTQVENAEDALHLARRQEELGQKGYADVVQLDADLADRKYEWIQAVNKMKDAYVTLQDVMFWPAGDTLVIDVSFADEGNADQTVDEPCSLDRLTETAIASVPEVAIAKGNMQNAAYELKTAKWQLAPSLNLYGGWSTSYYTYPGQAGYVPTPYWEQFRNNGGEYIQLTLSIPIFGRLAKYSNISRKKNELRRMSAEYEKTLRNIESEVKRAVQDRDGASLAYLQAERRSAVQEEAFELNRKKFEQGLISSIEYQTASGNYLKAKAERLNALLQYRLKKKIVAYYGGIPYIEQE